MISYSTARTVCRYIYREVAYEQTKRVCIAGDLRGKTGEIGKHLERQASGRILAEYLRRAGTGEDQIAARREHHLGIRRVRLRKGSVAVFPVLSAMADDDSSYVTC